MRRRRGLIEAWARLGTDVLSRIPDIPTDPRSMIDFVRGPNKLASELHDAWLETLGGVSRAKYLAILEENLELRRRLERVQPRPSSPPEEVVEAASDAFDDAFKQIRSAQEQWLSMWMPSDGATTRKA